MPSGREFLSFNTQGYQNEHDIVTYVKLSGLGGCWLWNGINKNAYRNHYQGVYSANSIREFCKPLQVSSKSNFLASPEVLDGKRSWLKTLEAPHISRAWICLITQPPVSKARCGKFWFVVLSCLVYVETLDPTPNLEEAKIRC